MKIFLTILIIFMVIVYGACSIGLYMATYHGNGSISPMLGLFVFLEITLVTVFTIKDMINT